MERYYLCIDLKTFYASVECVERGLDPFEVCLVVADDSRGQGAITLAVSPKLKAMGVKNRSRLYEIDKSISYIVAKPRMKLYMQYSAMVYGIYLKYVSKDDIHVYSVDEAFLDVSSYLKLYQKNPRELAHMIMDDIMDTLGICATCGIGTNMYLAKIALDLISKHNEEHVGVLNEFLYQKYLWKHQPLDDFWQIGSGIRRRLESINCYCMEDIAKCEPALLKRLLGINAQYLIDHAYGRESVTIKDIKQYKGKSHSISQSQILFEDYNFVDALVVMKEMVELKVLDLVAQHVVTNNISLVVNYSKNTRKASGGSRKLVMRTNSYHYLLKEFELLYLNTTSRTHPIRQIGISFNQVVSEDLEYYDLFCDYDEILAERKLNQVIVEIKEKHGKNAILKGMNMQEKATTRKRNLLIGGHNAQ